MRLIDLTGNTYGKLKVLGTAKERSGGHVVWKCICDCGTKKNVRGSHLSSGRISSCGCARSQKISSALKRHGMTRTRPYRIWRNMINRCHYDGYHEKQYYADKGITVCDRWRKSFEAFISDMGVPNENLTIDRIDGNKGYYKKNCRWATYKEQAKNRDQKSVNK